MRFGDGIDVRDTWRGGTALQAKLWLLGFEYWGERITELLYVTLLVLDGCLVLAGRLRLGGCGIVSERTCAYPFHGLHMENIPLLKGFHQVVAMTSSHGL